MSPFKEEAKKKKLKKRSVWDAVWSWRNFFDLFDIIVRIWVLILYCIPEVHRVINVYAFFFWFWFYFLFASFILHCEMFVSQWNCMQLFASSRILDDRVFVWRILCCRIAIHISRYGVVKVVLVFSGGQNHIVWWMLSET